MYKKGNKSEKKTRGESYSVLKKKTKHNNKKKYVKNDNFGKKEKLQSQMSQLNIEEINSIKKIFKKIYIGEFFFKKKITKLNSQPT